MVPHRWITSYRRALATNEKGEDFREAAGSAYDSWTYDVEAAKELWKTGLGELGKDSLSFTLMCEDTDSAQAVAQFLQSEWQNNLPGLTIELQVLPKKAVWNTCRKVNMISVLPLGSGLRRSDD